MSKDKHVDRRRFFREALGELFRPVADALEPIEKAARQIARADPPVPARTEPLPFAPGASGPWLRPPGSRPEADFQSICSRCGDCVRVCPAQCIKIEPGPGGRGGGLPFIDPDEMPCVLCDGLLCMHNCPTNALVPTPLEMIDMGTAHWREELCVRSRGQECTICVDRCPVGPAAIELRNNAIHVHEQGCTGCGVCQHDCPTSPKSIVVIPRSGRDE
jgi:ferredoxin-type protein NapG